MAAKKKAMPKVRDAIQKPKPRSTSRSGYSKTDSLQVPTSVNNRATAKYGRMYQWGTGSKATKTFSSGSGDYNVPNLRSMSPIQKKALAARQNARRKGAR